ncbi:chemotaxis protein CheW [Saccharospirillum mangrovi]|uniref:chemotaxis protein CheW n=1 Tax=Saccharospirillum mangrovi TaxID=2161747 RepID=UPI0013009FB3|nr:chemotaxis protein CheW [Saccharospirillum mangrovi]
MSIESEATATAGTGDERLATFWVPMQQKSLLVPQVAIAEVVAKATLQAVPDAPVWLLGRLDWRGQSLPVLSYEAANGQTQAPDSPGVRLAIFNTLSDGAALPFWALRIQGIPRLLRLSDAEVREDSLARCTRAERLAVITQLGKASIPDLDYLESLAASIGITSAERAD